jgi:hypothetical protein
VRLHADHNKYRIRIDRLLDLASNFFFELSEGSDTQTVSINRQGVKSYKYRMHPRRWAVKIQCADKGEFRMFQEEGEMRSFSRVWVDLGQWMRCRGDNKGCEESLYPGFGACYLVQEGRDN